MKVGCSIVCYKNAACQIEKVLESVTCSAPPGAGWEVALSVIDNSPDDRLRSVASRYGAGYRHEARNLGYGTAHNIALRNSLSMCRDYHLVVNPDVHFGPEVLPQLVEYLERHRDIAILMPDIRYPDGRRQHLCKLLPTPADLILRRFLPGWYDRTGCLTRYELRNSGYDRIMDVPVLSGCFMLLRASVLSKTGIFDERYFLYMEDVDLCRRIGEVGRTVYYPGVFITHEYIRGSYSNWRLLLNHMHSATRYFNKWGWFVDPHRTAVNRRCLQAIASWRETSDPDADEGTRVRRREAGQ